MTERVRRRRSAAAAAVTGLALALLLAGSTRTDPVHQPAAAPSLLVGAGVPYATGRVLDVYRPAGRHGPYPVVVMLHGCCGDRSDLLKLAEATAAAGVLVLNANWAGLNADAAFPAAYQDAACAVRYARWAAAGWGGDPSRVTLLGWSDGALVASVLALAGPRFAGHRCRAPALDPRPDALVGVGGYYGWRLPVPRRLVTARTVRFFGGTPETAARSWHDATPYGWLSAPAGPVRATLLVGQQDPLRADAGAFAAALRRAGHRVSLVVVPPAGDQSLISPRTEEGRVTVREIVATASPPQRRGSGARSAPTSRSNSRGARPGRLRSSDDSMPSRAGSRRSSTASRRTGNTRYDPSWTSNDWASTFSNSAVPSSR